MNNENRHVRGQWVVLSAVAGAMDEDGLSPRRAMSLLRKLLSDQPLGPAIIETIDRLNAERDEVAFRFLLGEEQLRLMALDDGRH